MPDLVYRPWSLEGDRIESRDISGSLPVVQVGMVWRRGSGLPQAARDFIGIAQSQRTVRQRPRSDVSTGRSDIGFSDIGFLINEFAKPAVSRHLSLRGHAAVRERPRQWEICHEIISENLHRA